MDIIAVIVWTIVILGGAALCYWAVANYAPVPFKQPLYIVITVVAGIFLVYLLGGLLVKVVPPFPGLLMPLRPFSPLLH